MISGTSAAEIERKPMIIDETLFHEFRERYGSVWAQLVIFHTQVKLHGNSPVLRALYPERTYYHYRNILVRDGYLTMDDFRKG